MSEQHEPLALKYRPGRFADLSGQTSSAAVLYLMARARQVPPVLLFWGTHGCGKTTTARIVAKALNCEAAPGRAGEWPCGVCTSCKSVDAQTSPDVMEIDAASNGNVERIRGLRETVLYATGGEWRVVILDEAHSISGAGFEATLKMFEEPPPNTVFILCTTEPGKIPKTVRSRCMKFPFHPMPDLEIIERLRFICSAENIPADTGLLASIAEAAGGSMRDAIMQLDQVTSVGITTTAMWRELTGEDDYATKLVCAAASADYPAMFAALDSALYTSGDFSAITSQLVRCLRDMLTLSSGGTVAATGEALRVREALARRLGAGRLMAAIRVLWDLQTKVRSENRREGLELAVAMVSEKLCPPASPAVVAPAVVAPASKEELHSLLG